MSQSSFSVILRAAEYYAGAEKGCPSRKVIDALYPDGIIPFKITSDYALPLHMFSNRLSNFLVYDEEQLDANVIWRVITARENIIRMMNATEMGRTAAESLSFQFMELFPESVDVSNPDKKTLRRKQMIGYTIKVVMEMFGYQVCKKRMQVSTWRVNFDHRKKRFFITASSYQKIEKEDIKTFEKNIAQADVRTEFRKIMNLILEGKTEYQKLYSVDQQNTWDRIYK